MTKRVSAEQRAFYYEYLAQQWTVSHSSELDIVRDINQATGNRYKLRPWSDDLLEKLTNADVQKVAYWVSRQAPKWSQAGGYHVQTLTEYRGS